MNLSKNYVPNLHEHFCRIHLLIFLGKNVIFQKLIDKRAECMVISNNSQVIRGMDSLSRGRRFKTIWWLEG